MTRTTNIIVMGWLVGFALVLSASAQQKSDAGQSAGADKSKTITLQQVVKELSDEAEKALKDQKYPPRSASDYATKLGDAKLSDADLMTGLTRPADRNPLVDSYIKWQLLSFKPDFAAMDNRDLIRVVDAIPAPQASGQMSQRDMALVRSASKGGGNVAALQKIYDEYTAQQKQVNSLNKPNAAYRKAVFAAAAASSDRGIALIAKLKEIELMIDGGEDKQVGSLAKKLAEELQSLRTDRSLTGAMRGELNRRVIITSKHQREVVSSFTLKASGETKFSEKTVTLSQNYVDQMQAYLAGREYTPPKK